MCYGSCVCILGYYVSLSDSFQRVILFTTHKIAADRASGSQMVKMMAKITLSLKAVGLSLVNDLKRTEVSYIGLTQYKRQLLTIIRATF